MGLLHIEHTIPKEDLCRASCRTFAVVAAVVMVVVVVVVVRGSLLSMVFCSVL